MPELSWSNKDQRKPGWKWRVERREGPCPFLAATILWMSLWEYQTECCWRWAEAVFMWSSC